MVSGESIVLVCNILSICTPRIGLRLDIMILQHEFKEAVELIKPDISTLLTSIEGM